MFVDGIIINDIETISIQHYTHRCFLSEINLTNFIKKGKKRRTRIWISWKRSKNPMWIE